MLVVFRTWASQDFNLPLLWVILLKLHPGFID